MCVESVVWNIIQRDSRPHKDCSIATSSKTRSITGTHLQRLSHIPGVIPPKKFTASLWMQFRFLFLAFLKDNVCLSYTGRHWLWALLCPAAEVSVLLQITPPWTRVNTVEVKRNYHHLLGRSCPTLNLPWALSKMQFQQWQKEQWQVKTRFKSTAKYNWLEFVLNLVYISAYPSCSSLFSFSDSYFEILVGPYITEVFTVKEPMRLLYNFFTWQLSYLLKKVQKCWRKCRKRWWQFFNLVFY